MRSINDVLAITQSRECTKNFGWNMEGQIYSNMTHWHRSYADFHGKKLKVSATVKPGCYYVPSEDIKLLLNPKA